MSSSSAAATQPPRVIRSGLKLKGGIVIRAAPPPSVAQSKAAPATTTTTKRKQHPDAQHEPSATITSLSVKSESPSSADPPFPTSADESDALPSAAPTYVKRTKRADDVELVNAQLQLLNKQTESKDRRQLIEEDRRTAAQQLTGVEERPVDGVRLVDASREYVKHGFGDEKAMAATRRLNEREKKKSDRYCK